jgi:hypothetical protein
LKKNENTQTKVCGCIMIARLLQEPPLSDSEGAAIRSIAQGFLFQQYENLGLIV